MTCWFVARSELDPDVRADLYYQANAVIHGVVPGVPVVHNGAVFAGLNGITGFNPVAACSTTGTW